MTHKHTINIHPSGPLRLVAEGSKGTLWVRIFDDDSGSQGELATVFWRGDEDTLRNACDAFNAVVEAATKGGEDAA